jgi:sec-independent protein translocase protein TatB
MFGMGFMEIFLVLTVAIIALGPEKLPTAAIDIAKFFKKFKNSIDDAKSTLNEELNLSEFTQKADKFKIGVNDITNLAHLEIKDLNVASHISKKKSNKNKLKKKQKKSNKVIDANMEEI